MLTNEVGESVATSVQCDPELVRFVFIEINVTWKSINTVAIVI